MEAATAAFVERSVNASLNHRSFQPLQQLNRDLFRGAGMPLRPQPQQLPFFTGTFRAFARYRL